MTGFIALFPKNPITFYGDTLSDLKNDCVFLRLIPVIHGRIIKQHPNE